MRKLAFISLCAALCTPLQFNARAGEPRRATPTAPVEFLHRTNPVEYGPQVLTEAKSLYERECKKCHGPDGKGRGSATRGMTVKPPDYTDENYMSSRPDGQLVWIILNGSDPDTTEMSGFKRKLSEDDAWKLVLFIRQFSRRPEVQADSKH